MQPEQPHSSPESVTKGKETLCSSKWLHSETIRRYEMVFEYRRNLQLRSYHIMGLLLAALAFLRPSSFVQSGASPDLVTKIVYSAGAGLALVSGISFLTVLTPGFDNDSSKERTLRHVAMEKAIHHRDEISLEEQTANLDIRRKQVADRNKKSGVVVNWGTRFAMSSITLILAATIWDLWN